jgi:hypothetical protein
MKIGSFRGLSMRVFTIATVSEYVSRLETIKRDEEVNGNMADLLFRGQACDKPLLPKLGRHPTKGKLKKIEKLLLKEFSRTSIAFREYKPTDSWDLLALAQHHGLPTRLLDWTYSALAALWFVVRKPAEKSESGKFESGVVWVLCPFTEDFRLETHGASPLDNDARTLVFRPKAISPRIVAQSGVFTVHKLIDGSRFIPLEKNRRYKNKLIKLLVPAAQFPSIRRELDMFNANASLLFPDLDGLCSHLSWRYTKLSDELTPVQKGPRSSKTGVHK